MKSKKAVSNIIILGLVSLFVDMSTEMVYPLVPLFLTATLGASPAIVGVIEGIAESIASLLKVFSGYIGDVRHNKKRLAIAGYSGAVFYKIVLLLAASWPGVLVARIIDRTGKGLRTAPRDALVAQSSARGKLGGAYGLHKMLDMAGSSLGVVLAYLFVAGDMEFHRAFVYSIIPAAIGIAILFAVREDKAPAAAPEKLRLKGLKLDRKLTLYLGVLFVFCLGNSSNAFFAAQVPVAGLFHRAGDPIIPAVQRVRVRARHPRRQALRPGGPQPRARAGLPDLRAGVHRVCAGLVAACHRAPVRGVRPRSMR